MLKCFVLVLTGFSFIFTTACTTLELRIERTQTPDQVAISTLASLMLSTTKNALLATQGVITTTPTPSRGTVRGKICYPSENIPVMTIYFRDVLTNQLSELAISENQMNYVVQLAPGKYYAYAWVSEYQIGGMYSKAVECGLGNSCNDHSPLLFEVKVGVVLDGIDLCDWVIPQDQLPLSLPTQSP
jgi:hypothetical protein